jgi:hypothetical protein
MHGGRIVGTAHAIWATTGMTVFSWPTGISGLNAVQWPYIF